MSNDIVTRKQRRTKVQRAPYFRPDKAEWTFVPVGRTHRAVVAARDNATGLDLPPSDVYAAKGWLPLNMATAEQKELLPSNWEELSQGHPSTMGVSLSEDQIALRDKMLKDKARAS